MTPEGKVKRKITALLKHYGCWYYMPVPSGFGRRTVDYLCLHRGWAFAIEAKRPGKDATTLQTKELEAIVAAGGRSFVVSNDEELAVLNKWLNERNWRL